MGACAALEPADVITSTHRGHGHLVAKGGEPKYMMAELAARTTGYCGGKGGSLHMTDFSLGILGANGIVAGGIPIAVGAALAFQQKKDRGSRSPSSATARPTKARSTRRSTWPACGSCRRSSSARTICTARAPRRTNRRPWPTWRSAPAATPCPASPWTATTCWRCTRRRRSRRTRARSGGGPTLIEGKTYRQHGHYEGDPMVYRSKVEMDEWKGRDPVLVPQPADGRSRPARSRDRQHRTGRAGRAR